jgi:diguanylate cyclase (GGDEF)-like protein/PAS domain S-box-containing protein
MEDLHGLRRRCAPVLLRDRAERPSANAGGGCARSAHAGAAVAADRTSVAPHPDLHRLAFEVAPVGILLVAVDGTAAAANEAACELLGRTEDEIVGESLEGLASTEHLAEDIRQITRCLEGTQRAFTGQRRLEHGRTGEELWVDVHLSVIRDADGRPHHFVVHVIDVTERRAAILASAAAEARFAAMVEHGSDLIAVADVEGRLLYASPAYRTVLGIDPAAWRGQQLLERVHPDDQPQVVAAGAAIVATPGATASLLMRYQHDDGSWIWMEATMTNRLDHPGVGGFVVNSHDVTAHKQAAELLRHQATHDLLTGLPNRGLLAERLAELVAARRADEAVAVLYVDVDHFKATNDTLGHAAGDQLLVDVAARLQATCGADDTVARIGGDEFVVVTVVERPAAAHRLAASICEAFVEPFAIDDVVVDATASIGLATSVDVGDGIDLLQAADLALYEAKSIGRNCWVGYVPYLQAAVAPSRPARRPDLDRRARATQRHRDFVATSPRQLLVHVDGVIVASSPSADELLGCSGGSGLLGRHLLELVRPEHLDDVAAQLELQRSGAWPDPGPVELCSLDGSRVRVRICSTPLTWDGEDAVLTAIEAIGIPPRRSQHEQLIAHLPAQVPTAIAEGQLVLAYQPIVDLDGRARKVEALVRWNHPTLGILLPGTFIGAVEHSPHVGALTGEVLRQACDQVARWRAGGLADLEVAVNISRRELIDSRIVDRVRTALASSGLPARALWVETTETTTALDHPRARRTIEQLRALGVRFALDDFGTGFATLAELHRFPPDALKIDRMFVDGLPGDDGDAAIVRSVVTLGEELGLHVIAEGVETVAQRDALVALGCTLFQGYLFARPAAAEDAPAWGQLQAIAST